ncbi:MAG: porin family protein [Bacteroidia bacterium]|nr:porin family protein [Bacteroidia bacterium]
MKKIVLVLAMVAMVGAMSAQELTFGVKGGLNMSNFTGKGVKDTKMKLGFNVGIAADYEFAENMAIQSGLYFMSKGAKKEIALGKDKITHTANAYYLQIPVHFAYKVDIAPETRIVFHAGPYVAYGVGGKSKYDSKYTDILKKAGISLDQNTFDKKVGYKPFDAGIGLGVGAEFGSFLVDLGWDMGLVNISRVKDAPVKTQNAYLSVGYKF